MHRGLVALSASAVAAVYMAGYARTQSADAAIAAATTDPPATNVVAAAPPSPTQMPVVTPTPLPQDRRRGDGEAEQRGGFGQRPAAPTPAPPAPSPTTRPAAQNPPAAASKPQTTGQFKDGTYTGSGTSRRGDVWVSVDVAGGRITNVSITRSTLQYPLRDIANLPGEVVQRQSANVDIVSRATYSSQAFRTAVSQALQKAA